MNIIWEMNIEAIISKVERSSISFWKFITANDAGATGAHQAGFHLHKNAWPLFFEAPGNKGTNKDNFIRIRWCDTFDTESRFIYYGVGTRNEYRLTRFGRNFPFLNDEHIGSLLVLGKSDEGEYFGYVLDKDEEMDSFFAAFNMSAADSNNLIVKSTEVQTPDLLHCFKTYLNSVSNDFPPSADISTAARSCFNSTNLVSTKMIRTTPDKILLEWLEAEFNLFKLFEIDRYGVRLKSAFSSVEELVNFANTVLNRRKTRAGKSLENHLTEVFTISGLQFASQPVIEENKRPDFIFPGTEAYCDPKFRESKLTFLAAKTTCKDRWRQVLNEADRIKNKHLFTLQQGISSKQLQEMQRAGVVLVVPKKYLDAFPSQHRDSILTLQQFITHVRSK